MEISIVEMILYGFIALTVITGTGGALHVHVSKRS